MVTPFITTTLHPTKATNSVNLRGILTGAVYTMPVRVIDKAVYAYQRICSITSFKADFGSEIYVYVIFDGQPCFRLEVGCGLVVIWSQILLVIISIVQNSE
jgi:hypothetical protein